MSTQEFDCNTCNHTKINDDPELHCYMFKVPPMPPGQCMQHTTLRMVGNSNDIVSVIMAATLSPFPFAI